MYKTLFILRAEKLFVFCWRSFFWLFILCLFLCNNLKADMQEFTLFTYHDKAPYYMENYKDNEVSVNGIYKELVDLLNDSQNYYRFYLSFLPRNRLQRYLELNDLEGGVIGVNPLWFNDKEKEKYLWTGKFMLDYDVIVVKQGHVFPYKHPRDLIGKRLTLSRGHYYWGVTELQKEGKIHVEETSSDIQNLLKIISERSDATITSILTYRFFTKDRFTENELDYLTVPHDNFDRMILIPRRYAEVFEILQNVLHDILENDKWIEILKKYDYSLEL